MLKKKRSKKRKNHKTCLAFFFVRLTSKGLLAILEISFSSREACFLLKRSFCVSNCSQNINAVSFLRVSFATAFGMRRRWDRCEVLGLTDVLQVSGFEGFGKL